MTSSLLYQLQFNLGRVNLSQLQRRKILYSALHPQLLTQAAYYLSRLENRSSSSALRYVCISSHAFAHHIRDLAVDLRQEHFSAFDFGVVVFHTFLNLCKSTNVIFGSVV